jgi:hypothetical protein
MSLMHHDFALDQARMIDTQRIVRNLGALKEPAILHCNMVLKELFVDCPPTEPSPAAG